MESFTIYYERFFTCDDLSKELTLEIFNSKSFPTIIVDRYIETNKKLIKALSDREFFEEYHDLLINFAHKYLETYFEGMEDSYMTNKDEILDVFIAVCSKKEKTSEKFANFMNLVRRNKVYLNKIAFEPRLVDITEKTGREISLHPPLHCSQLIMSFLNHLDANFIICNKLRVFENYKFSSEEIDDRVSKIVKFARNKVKKTYNVYFKNPSDARYCLKNLVTEIITQDMVNYQNNIKTIQELLLLGDNHHNQRSMYN